VSFAGSLSVLRSVIWVRRVTAVANPIPDCLSGLERVGGAVVLVWLALALAGAWRPDPDWIDRSGRAVGTVLIVVYFLAILRFLVP
jgi:hypothetical protein